MLVSVVLLRVAAVTFDKAVLTYRIRFDSAGGQTNSARLASLATFPSCAKHSHSNSDLVFRSQL